MLKQTNKSFRAPSRENKGPNCGKTSDVGNEKGALRRLCRRRTMIQIKARFRDKHQMPNFAMQIVELYTLEK